ncbi:MAG TPA: hypothetical protein VK745_17205 [Polyangiaceae bacterium]|nr:hypothetical protein [Polyangiaceae bacterium]
MKRTSWFGIPCAVGSVLAVSLSACDQTVPPEYPVAVAQVPTPQATPEPAPKASGAAWSSMPPSSEVVAVEGKPAVMALGAPCKTFRRLPASPYLKDTLIVDACLEIPSNTTVEVHDGVTLAIVATNGLLLGRNVVFSASGSGGRRGARAQFASIPFNPSTDAEIQALCVERGNQCACPNGGASLPSIRGQSGGGGSPGGSVRLIASELISPSKLSGFGVDVSGGAGGPQGESGTQECARGSIRRSSPACAAGLSSGSAGATGQLFVALGGSNGAASMQRMKAATVPADPSAAAFLDLGASLTDRISELNAEALQKGWQRRSGEEPY